MEIRNDRNKIIGYACDGCTEKISGELPPKKWRNFIDRHYCAFCNDYFYDNERVFSKENSNGKE